MRPHAFACEPRVCTPTRPVSTRAADPHRCAARSVPGTRPDAPEPSRARMHVGLIGGTRRVHGQTTDRRDKGNVPPPGGPGRDDADSGAAAPAIRMHYNADVSKAVRDSESSADHIAAHGVTLDEKREAILDRPYWAAPGRDGTTLVYGRAPAPAGICWSSCSLTARRRSSPPPVT
jgi:hypothetical protein